MTLHSRWYRLPMLASPLIFAVSTVAATVANAQPQTPARSLDELRSRLQVGDKVTVTDENGEETTGKVTTLSSSTLALMANGIEHALGEDRIALIQQRKRDSELNGAVVGAAILGGLSSLVFLADDCDPSCGAIVAIYAGIGAAVGAMVDAAVRDRRTIFLRPTVRAGRSVVFASPLAGRRRVGAMLSVRF